MTMKIKALLAFLGLFGLQVYAAVPAEVKETIKDVKEDISTIGWLLIGLAAVAMGIRWIKAQFF